MANRRKVSNLLALSLLNLLMQRPMYPYEMASELRTRGKDQSIKINWGSLYTIVQNLEKYGYIEAVAPDGLTEAVSLPGARFVVGVQWHPEYKPLGNPVSCALFAAFGDACRAAAQAGTAAKRRAA